APFSPGLAGIHTLISQYRSMVVKSSTELRYRLPHLNNVEDGEKYRRGGYHPIHLGDTFNDGRYRVLHKLGYGGFSTVWLARDANQDRLVSLKVLTAEASRRPTEFKLLRRLDEYAQGDITPKNVLLRLSGIDAWPTEIVYQQVGRPPDLSAPEYLVEPASFSCVDLDYISEHILLIDLGEAFPELSPPPNGVGTPVSYRSPELTLERKASRASDIWALACTIFEMRSGFPLFESFVGSSSEILEEIVRILGVPLKSSHHPQKQDGITIADHAQLNGFTLNDRIREIGMHDQESFMHDGDVASLNHHTLLEPSGVSITIDEANDLTDLLRRTLDYTPEKRLSAEQVANHSWLVNSQ
ncbi:hypothetical protein MMC11_006246, partial [Xylographa trunciseda]|nr:hypothetical protein [Xylographa trunciseda]